ncbi:MBL fold metallo-hydrolase [Paucibacter sp. APW11]|uniref:MBL fold metallo-hydrolase n=1 Tax=Roseateles aquae TaxID=3077235 RepID=A0ABU3PHR9_9BURK|nr:MBL fold metallo-hydrolase [Paucibacter sp. APW11]MDT9002102.1 MBL fold metallo-hydrolase [Paucibacter sp. APW11]
MFPDSNVHPVAAGDEFVYLKSDVKIEPLVCGWYAWSHLVSPAALALHLRFRMLPLLRNFVDNPSIHVSANLDPNMYGGPFVSLAEADIAAVRQLIEDTETTCAELLAFADEYRAFDARLQQEAQGGTLNDYYTELPQALRGCLELVYDLHHRPALRLFEALLYAQGLAVSTQQVLLQSLREDERHFFMSTPRLPAPGSVTLPLRFSDARLDLLARARSKPASFNAIAEQLELAGEQRTALRAMFDTTPPRRRGPIDHSGDGVRVRYFGHACVLFQTAEVSVLFDPFVSIEEADDERFTINDLPERIDYVVLSHSHQDHFSPEMLIQLRHRIGQVIVPANNSGHVADPSMKLALGEMGFGNVVVLDCLDTVQIPGGRICSLPFTGEHADLSIYSKHAVALNLGGRNFVFLVDSDGRDLVMYEHMRRAIGGRIDALFIGMECHGAPLNWLYEPLLGKPLNRRNNEARRLSGADCDRAWGIVGKLEPARVFVYAMGQEPWMRYIMGLQYSPDSIQLTESQRFIDRCRSHGMEAERLYLSGEWPF